VGWWYGLLVVLEVSWLVVKDPGHVWLAHEFRVMSRDVVEACWCLTIALVLHEGCRDRRVDDDPLGYGNVQGLMEGWESSCGGGTSMAWKLLS